MSRQLECPNCHLRLSENDKVCPFCGHDLSKEIAQENADFSTPQEVEKKNKLPLFALVYIICAGVSLLPFLLMILPALSANGETHNSYYYLVTSNLQIGANTPTIVFIFSLVGFLDLVAVLRSVQKKTSEIDLFAYFATGLFILVAAMAFLGGPLASTGTNTPTFSTGIGLYIIGVLAILLAVGTVFGTILYKRFLVESPIENAKTK